MYTMKEVCEQVDMPYETLKYYCNEGLVPNVKRDQRNYRVFDERDVTWIKGLSCLKRCGMSIAEMKRYKDLCLEGQGSIPERNVMLDEKKTLLMAQLNEITACIAYIDQKQQFYNDVESGKIPYMSNLIQHCEKE